MKKSMILSAFVCLTTLCSIKAQETGSLTVTVSNIKTQEGVIMVGLYKDENTFLEKVFKTQKTEANSDSVTLTFDHIPAGEYGISLFHDKDENGKLNTNFIGIPSEPYAFSNNAKGMFGPAKWEDVKFSVIDKETIQNIKL